jgi:hypothetical protein
LLANNGIIVGCGKEHGTRNATRNILDAEKGDVAELEAIGPQQGLYIFSFREHGHHLLSLLKAFFAASNKNLFQYADEIACRLNLQYVFSHSPAVPAVERERILPPSLASAKPPA